ncbi:MAG: cation diffusion facilitator family transporter [Methylocystis sp.]|uniref:cation diffusion facilitator family transporter n=1 Tax=Methylocystis sp. TaxID=1911079 RepID=UPI003D12C953
MTETKALPRAATSVKLAAAKASIAASAFLAVAKLAAGLWSGSLALLSEAGHAFVDTGATVLTFFAVREAEKPADEKHHYGHGKYEALAALIETGFLFGLAVFVVAEAWRRLQEPNVEIDAGWPIYGVLVVSIVIDYVRSRRLSRIAKAEGSDALAADALHFASDLVSSTLVLIGLIAAQYGFERGDAFAALGVAAFIAIAGFRLGRRTIDTLLDAAPREAAPLLERSIAEVPGVIAIDSLRLRTVGPDIVGEATIGVSRGLRVEQAARIKSAVAEAIADVTPRARVTLSIEPRALDDETVAERILLVGARRHIHAHHVIAQQIDGRLSIGVDIELDGAMPLGEAHAVAADFESALRDEFGADAEVETHIEPLETQLLAAHAADPAAAGAIVAALARVAAQTRPPAQIGDIRVRDTAGGFVVNFRCRLDADVSVQNAHDALDEIERRTREEFPEILRIVGRAEPGGRRAAR